MKTLQALLDQDPAWPLIKRWAAESKSHIQVLPCSNEDGEKTLLALQVSTHSTLGSVALNCGGIVVDQGWLRVLGAGHPQVFGNLRNWNQLGGETLDGMPRIPGALVVGYDVLGGLFVVNGGGLEGTLGNVVYYSPDTLEWEDTELGHSAFIHWALSDRVANFYGDDRWPAYHLDVKDLPADRGFDFYPPLWSAAEDVRSRKVVPLRELIPLHFQRRTEMELSQK